MAKTAPASRHGAGERLSRALAGTIGVGADRGDARDVRGVESLLVLHVQQHDFGAAAPFDEGKGIGDRTLGYRRAIDRHENPHRHSLLPSAASSGLVMGRSRLRRPNLDHTNLTPLHTARKTAFDSAPRSQNWADFAEAVQCRF
jgi:hypothetical protein